MTNAINEANSITLLGLEETENGRNGDTVASQMKKLCPDTERIVYRFIFGEGMVILAGCSG
ncbi:hypothetical protein KAX97_05145 [candidate division WOR-3 bacterium]|nr:hypothetical protein [candidate division WOR-3 bacterium]